MLRISGGRSRKRKARFVCDFVALAAALADCRWRWTLDGSDEDVDAKELGEKSVLAVRRGRLDAAVNGVPMALAEVILDGAIVKYSYSERLEEL